MKIKDLIKESKSSSIVLKLPVEELELAVWDNLQEKFVPVKYSVSDLQNKRILLCTIGIENEQ